MGVQRASRHWAGTAVLRENLDFFCYDTTMAQTLLLYHRESIGGSREQNREAKQSKAKTNILTLLSWLADAYRMHRGRGHEWFQTASPFQTHAAIPGESRTRRRTLKASLKPRKYQNLKVACKAFAKATAIDLDVGGPDGASEKVRGAARRPTRHNLGSFSFFISLPFCSEETRSQGAAGRRATTPTFSFAKTVWSGRV